jgi:UDP-3-O-[3-hydroxymyristoyl] glucosamine N-acyltransferase
VHYSVEALAAIVGGTVEGDQYAQITGARPITHAGAGDITFIEETRYAKLLEKSPIAAAIVGPAFPSSSLKIPVIRVHKPMEAFGKIVDQFRGPQRITRSGIHPSSTIASSARIGADANIGPYAVIGEDTVIGDRCRLMPGVVIGDGCRLGDDVVLHPHVVLYGDTVLGNRVVVHAGAVLGADGFGYRTEAGRHVKVPQRGRVEIGDDCEIGANTTIDRAAFEMTRIGEGTKIDNLVQIAHNCQIGRHNLIVSQVGLAGSCKTGDYVIIAGHAGVKDHITIGERAVLEAMSGVMEDVPAGEKWVGIPATPARDQFRFISMIRRLPELRTKLMALTRQVETIEQQLETKKRSA